MLLSHWLVVHVLCMLRRTRRAAQPLRMLPSPPPLPLQVHQPSALPGRDLLHLAHAAEYVDAFCGGSLGEEPPWRPSGA